VHEAPDAQQLEAGDYVYEPFSGSGTTIIAGEMTGAPRAGDGIGAGATSTPRFGDGRVSPKKPRSSPPASWCGARWRRRGVTPCGCWLWLGGDDGSGDHTGLGAYGRILRPGTRRVMPVHRYVYETFVGEIPFGYDVDHMCAKWAADVRTSRKCVNPDHLQAIPPHLNQQLKLLRRLGYGTQEMDFEDPPFERPWEATPAPILAPGERAEDLVF
jgi:hypothetical protein